MLLDITSSFYSWIRGGIFILFIYHFIFYVQNKEKLHKYYSGYLFCIVVYIIRDASVNEHIQYVYQYFSFPIQYLGYVFFIYFSRELAKSKERFPAMDRRVTNLTKIIFVFAIVLIPVQFFFGYEVQKRAVAYFVPFSTFCAFYIFHLLYKIRTTQILFLLIGSIFFLIFANISSLKMVKGEFFLLDFKVHRMFYYFVGAIIQSVIFAVLIGNNFREIIEEKKEAEVHLLKQKNQISNLKIIALKSQMNPHFLFNSLNSINNFVIQNKVEEASNFITKFSSLVRKVLQTTNENAITLSEELKILSIYVKLEKMRLKNNFEFITTVDPKIDAEQLIVVPLFLQPFVENAIWHGLSLKEGDKKINLNIKIHNDKIIVTIVDNGIGIKASQKLKGSKTNDRKSYGIEIVKERMSLLYHQESVVLVEDITKGNISGTKVSLVFPLKMSRL